MNILDRIACHLGIWAVRRLFGECQEDIRDFDPTAHCIRCDATRVIKEMREILEDA